MVNWKTISNNWNLEKSRLRTRWDKLTNGDLETVNGDRDRLIARLCERYGFTREDADRRVADWQEEIRDRLQADEAVERASEDSFPASDPPSWTPQSSVRKDPNPDDSPSAAPPRGKSARS